METQMTISDPPPMFPPDAPTFAQLALVTATHCCVCRLQLTDAESVEHGIGPICSKRYYDPVFVPTEDQVKLALGHLAVSNLPDSVIDGCLALVHNNQTDARKFCNLIIYYASANYNNRDEVFKCSAIIRCLGYVVLADKLEADRTSAVILDKGDVLNVFLPDQPRISNAVRALKGSDTLTEDVQDEMPVLGDDGPRGTHKERVKQGRKLGWIVQKANLTHLECILGVYIPNELISYGGAIRKIAKRTRYELLAFTVPAAPKPTIDSMLIVRGNGRMDVKTPYNGQFVADLKFKVPYRDRTWNPNARVWDVASHHFQTVRDLIQIYFQETV